MNGSRFKYLPLDSYPQYQDLSEPFERLRGMNRKTPSARTHQVTGKGSSWFDQVSMRDVVEADGRGHVDNLVAKFANEACHTFLRAQEDLIEMFLISGAFPQDLCLEQGPVVMETIQEVGYRVAFRMSFRMT